MALSPYERRRIKRVRKSIEKDHKMSCPTGKSKYATGGMVNKRFSPIARPQRFAGTF